MVRCVVALGGLGASVLLATMLIAEPCAAPTPVTPRMRTFGHSVKAGHLPPAGTEVTTF